MVAADEEGSAPPLQFRTADLDAVIEAINVSDPASPSHQCAHVKC